MTGSAADRLDQRGVLYVLGAAFGLGTLGTVSSLAYGTGMSAPTFTALRAALGGAILALLVATGRSRRVVLGDIPARQRRMLAIAVIANATMNLVLFIAFGLMTVALVMTLYYTYPLVVAVGSALTGRERFSRLRAGAIALAMAGLVLVVSSQVGPNATISPVGVELGLLASLCQATYLLVSRDGYSSVPPEQATSLILAGGAVLSGVMAVLVAGGSPFGQWVTSLEAWLAILFAGTVGAALAKVWLLRGVRRIGGIRAAVVMLAEPVVGVAVAAIVLGQPLTASEIVGGLAILVAAALVQRPVIMGAGAATAPEPAMDLPGI
jgi:drug/metabolite transporter (DMT)-like permease